MCYIYMNVQNYGEQCFISKHSHCRVRFLFENKKKTITREKKAKHTEREHLQSFVLVMRKIMINLFCPYVCITYVVETKKIVCFCIFENLQAHNVLK